MSAMAKLLGSPTNLSGKEGMRKRLESVWELYLIWRSRDSRPAERGRVAERPTSGFLLLREIEATALDVVRLYLAEEIPCDFVVAVMQSTADTTSQFMLANPADADRYRRLGFEVFWSGLAIAETPVREGIEKPKRKKLSI